MNPEVVIDFPVWTQHPVMTALGLQRLVVAADGLFALLSLLGESRPGNRLGGSELLFVYFAVAEDIVESSSAVTK